MATDFIGQQLFIGDDVVFMQIGYRNLCKGVIRGISEKQLMIDHDKLNTCETQTKQFHGQVIKIPKEKTVSRNPPSSTCTSCRRSFSVMVHPCKISNPNVDSHFINTVHFCPWCRNEDVVENKGN